MKTEQSGSIGHPDFLKISFQIIKILDGIRNSSNHSKPLISSQDFKKQEQDGRHLGWFSNDLASGFQIQLRIQTIQKLTSFHLFEIWVCLVWVTRCIFSKVVWIIFTLWISSIRIPTLKAFWPEIGKIFRENFMFELCFFLRNFY